jgi:2-hydroxy-3-oxopropionate reductase
MGKPIAMNLATSGFDLMVYDVRDEPLKQLAILGAKIGKNPKEVGKHGEIIAINVVDEAQVEAAILGQRGVLGGTLRGSVIAIQSTVHPGTMKKISDAARQVGVGIVDAQISGGERGAYARSLTYMVGGEKEDIDKCRPMFVASGKKVYHMGALGMGAATKLAHQVIVLGTLMSVAEGMILAERAGVNLELFSEVVQNSSARSHIADGWVSRYRCAPKKLAESFYRSVLPALNLAAELDVPLPMTAIAQQLIRSRMPGQESPSEGAGKK